MKYFEYLIVLTLIYEEEEAQKPAKVTYLANGGMGLELNGVTQSPCSYIQCNMLSIILEVWSSFAQFLSNKLILYLGNIETQYL